MSGEVKRDFIFARNDDPVVCWDNNMQTLEKNSNI